MANPRKILGTMECPNIECKQPIPTKIQASGLAFASCAWCGLLCQAHGAESDQWIRARTTLKAPIEEAAGPGPQDPGDRPQDPAQGKGKGPEEERTIFDILGGSKKTRQVRA